MRAVCSPTGPSRETADGAQRPPSARPSRSAYLRDSRPPADSVPESSFQYTTPVACPASHLHTLLCNLGVANRSSPDTGPWAGPHLSPKMPAVMGIVADTEARHAYNPLCAYTASHGLLTRADGHVARWNEPGTPNDASPSYGTM